MSHVKLGDLFRVGSSKRVLQSQWTTEGVPFYRGREITKLAESGLVENDLFITEKLFNELSQRSGVPQAGDIMITAIGTIGNSYIVCPDDRFYFKDASVLWLSRNSDVSSEYINHWLKSPLFLDQLDRGNGATVDTLTIQKLQGVLVHVPSASEQRRIVTLLDEAFADIATAKANAEKNLQNARELGSVLSAQILSAPSTTCTTQSLEDIVEADCSLSYGIVQPGDEFESGLPIVRPVDLDRPLIELDGLKRIDPTLAKGYERTKLKGGEVLLCVRGTTGTLACASSALVGANVSRGIVPIRFKPSWVSQELGYFLMRSAPVQAQIRAKTYGTALMQINIRDLRQIQLPVPHPSQQAAIAKALQDAEDQTNRLAEIQSQKLTALDDLKKSLLRQAFSGLL